MSKIADLIYIAAGQGIHGDSNLVDKHIDLPCISSGDKIDIEQAKSDLANRLLEAGIGLDKQETEETLTWLVNGKFRGDLIDLIEVSLSFPTSMTGAVFDWVHGIPDFLQNLPEKGLSLEQILNDPIHKKIRGTLISLLNNESFARALIIYANINGVPLENSHIDFLKEQLADDNLNIVEAIHTGKELLKQKYSGKYNEIFKGLSKSCD